MYTQNGIGPKRVELLYSAKRMAARVQAQEIIISNLPTLPHPTRLWLTTDEWKCQPNPLPHDAALLAETLSMDRANM
jgi:hypothetical protein